MLKYNNISVVFPYGTLTLRSFCQSWSLEGIGESEGEAQEVYVSLHKNGCGFLFLCFVLYLVVVNSSEIVLWYQFCLPLLYSEVGVYNVLNSFTLITLPENLKLVVVHGFCLVIKLLSFVNLIKN